MNLQFELGETAVPAGGHLRVVWLWPFDWATPQAADSGAPDHVRASCSKPGVDLRVTCAFRGDLVPWNHQIDVEVVSGELTRGRPGGAGVPGVAGADLRGTRGRVALPHQPRGRPPLDPAAAGAGIRRWWPGPPARLVALAPADGLVGEDLELTLRVEDEWGNPHARRWIRLPRWWQPAE